MGVLHLHKSHFLGGSLRVVFPFVPHYSPTQPILNVVLSNRLVGWHGTALPFSWLTIAS
jgi:hypothetical protein